MNKCACYCSWYWDERASYPNVHVVFPLLHCSLLIDYCNTYTRYFLFLISYVKDASTKRLPIPWSSYKSLSKYWKQNSNRFHVLETWSDLFLGMLNILTLFNQKYAICTHHQKKKKRSSLLVNPIDSISRIPWSLP